MPVSVSGSQANIAANISSLDAHSELTVFRMHHLSRLHLLVLLALLTAGSMYDVPPSTPLAGHSAFRDTVKCEADVGSRWLHPKG